MKARNVVVVRLLVGFILVLCISDCHADRLPLWELGGAVGVAQLPYYRGSSESRNIVLPLPLAIYRGEKYGVDDEGAHRWLYLTDRMKLDISLAAGLPVPEGGSRVRQGMPELDALLEFGPSLDVSLWRSRYQKLTVHFPLRLATSIDWLEVGYRGIQFTPYINYVVQSYSRNYWEFNLAFGPQYASERYHDYYYEVDARYARPGRSAFDAKAGYSGSRITVYLQKKLGRLWLSAFARYDFLQDAVFNDSPLVEKSRYLIGGFVLGWVFMESPQKVIVNRRAIF